VLKQAKPVNRNNSGSVLKAKSAVSVSLLPVLDLFVLHISHQAHKSEQSVHLMMDTYADGHIYRQPSSLVSVIHCKHRDAVLSASTR